MWGLWIYGPHLTGKQLFWCLSASSPCSSWVKYITLGHLQAPYWMVHYSIPIIFYHKTVYDLLTYYVKLFYWHFCLLFPCFWTKWNESPIEKTLETTPVNEQYFICSKLSINISELLNESIRKYISKSFCHCEANFCWRLWFQWNDYCRAIFTWLSCKIHE